MKRLLYVVVLLALLAGAYWAGSWRGQQHAGDPTISQIRRVLYYVDPMNPAHTSQKPGKAPCGMDMEPVYVDETTGSAPASAAAGAIRVSAEKQQLIGVRIAPVESKALNGTLRLLGKVATDETRVYRINATIDGWITRALPLAAGSQVRKDETLAEFYSPEFLAASQALLYALSSADRAKPTGQETEMQRSQMANFELNLKQYRDALRNLGMGELQIQELVRTRQRTENVNITSPADGFILVRNVSDGQRFEKGTELFRIADLSRVWILADLFEREAAFAAPGTEVKFRVPHQQQTFSAVVSKALPQFDGVARTLKLRLDAANPDLLLKPDMFVDLDLPVSLPESVVIPTDAIINTGMRKVVYVETAPGIFEPRPVTTGPGIGEMVQVREGLTPGERIAISGTFLLDSESRMKLAAAGVHSAPVTDPVCGMGVDEIKARAAKRTSEINGCTYFFCNEGCKQQFDANPSNYLGDKKAQPTQMGQETVEAIDPVCGMKVTPEKARAAKRTAEHQGKTYYFCNEGCKEEFVANAAQFLKEAVSTSAGHDQPHH